jgi:PKD repeat protein
MNKLLTVCCVLSIVAVALFTAVPVKAQTAIIGFSPSTYVAHSIGENFTISINVTNVQNLWSWSVGISWDPNVLNLISKPREGPFLKANGGNTIFLNTTAVNGTMNELSSTLTPISEVSGSGVLATLAFNITKETVGTPITLFNTSLVAPNGGPVGQPIDCQVENATVNLILGNGPVADAGLDQTVNQGTQVVLNGSKTSSSDPNTNYTWSFTDGTLKTLEGMIVNYTFNTPGTYNVTLLVQNSYGNSTDTTTITVTDTTPPVAKMAIKGFTIGQIIPTSDVISFNGSGSTDLYSRIENYVWDMGDGSPILTGNLILHSYSNPGTYTVTLTVEDAAGLNGTATMTIDVTLTSTNTSSASLNLPTYLIGILSVATVLAIGGSVFWLRKPRMPKETKN